MTTRTIALESFKTRPGYEKQKFSDFCAVCPFCGKINDLTRTQDTRCPHLVRQTGSAYHEAAIFTSPPIIETETAETETAETETAETETAETETETDS